MCMWDIEAIVHYSLLVGFYIAIGLAAFFGRKAKAYLSMNSFGKGTLFLFLSMISYASVFFILHKLVNGFNFWFYFDSIFVVVALITHLFLPIEKWANSTGKGD